MNKIKEKLEALPLFSSRLSLQRKTALVVGAAGELGRAVAAAYVQLGAAVLLGDFPEHEQELKEISACLETDHKARVSYMALDFTKAEEGTSFVANAKSIFGSVDVLFNDLRFMSEEDTCDVKISVWKHIVDANLSASFFIARAAAEQMRADGHGGSIISSTTIAGNYVASEVGFGSSKAGVSHMSNALAIEYAKEGIRFNNLAYGHILTEDETIFGKTKEERTAYMQACARETPMGRMGMIEEVVGAVLYLSTDLSSFETASTLVLDGGLSVDGRTR